MRKLYLFLVGCFLVSTAVAQSLPTVDFTGFNGGNLGTISPGWSEASGTSTPTGTFSSWTRDDFANVFANGDAGRINIWSTFVDEWIISPAFLANSQSELKFDLALTVFSGTGSASLGSDDSLAIRTSVDGGATWQQLAVYTSASAISNTGQAEVYSLAAFAGQTMQVAFYASSGTVNDPEDNDLFIDNIQILNPLADDLEVTQILSPSGAACFGSAETVSVEIKNSGSNSIDFAVTNTPVSVSVAGPVTTSYATTLSSGTLGSDSTMMVTVTTAGDFSLAGTYTLTAVASMPGDLGPSNDTLVGTSITSPTVTAPFLEDFETASIGSPGTFPAGWTITTPNTFSGWFVEADGVSNSTGTGPIDDHTPGGSIYVYTETSSGSLGDTYTLTTPCIDMGAVVAPRLSFWYHMYGASMGTLKVSVIAGGTVTDLDSIVGQQQTGQNDPWLEKVVDLAAYQGQVIQLVFTGTRGLSFTGDMAIDDVSIFQPLLDDVTATSTSTSFGCSNADSAIVSVTITNAGVQTATGVTATFSVDGGAPVAPETIPDSIAPNASVVYTFSATADLSVSGPHQIITGVNVLNDGDLSNNADTLDISNNLSFVTAPLTEDFETSIAGSPGTFPPGWTITTPNTFSGWFVENDGVSNSSNTGPIDDHTPGGSVYVYTETSSGSLGDTYTLTTPCIDLDTLQSPKLSFWYHMYGITMGTLKTSVNVGGVITDLDSLVGQQQSAEADPWLERVIDLSAFEGQIVQLVWTGTRGSSFTGDMAIDDISIFQPALSDLTPISTNLSGAACGLDSFTVVSITVENVGVDTIQSGSAQYSLNGGAYTVAETIPGPIAPGATASYTFAALANMSAPGTYTLDFVSTAMMAPDENLSNDSLSSSVDNIPSVTPAFPYQDNFEGPTFWASGGINSSWELGSPGNVVIDTAASGALAWVTGDSSDYNVNEASFVASPCFDMTNAPANSWVSMKVWWESEFSWDGANLQTSTDGGVNWSNVGAFGDPNNWYTDNSINGNPGGSQEGWSGRGTAGSGGWVLAAHPLDSSLIGQSAVRFRVAFGSDGSVVDEGFAFDDFTLSQPPVIGLPDSLVVCGTETLDAGNPGSTFLWSTGDVTQTLTLNNTTGVDIIDSSLRVTVTDTFGLSSEAIVVVTIPATTPDVMASETTANLCNGDSIAVATAMTTGGNGFVMYTWNTSPVQMGAIASNLPAGSYTVSVVDSLGCQDTDTVVIGEPTAVAVALDTIVTPLCFGDSTGEVSITTSGGTAPYTYSWDNGGVTEDLTGVPAGSYVGTITDANGCVLVSPTLTVGQPDSLTVALDALTDASCPDALDGAISITTGGGVSPYTYLWDNGSTDEDLTGLAPGDYVGTITDANGCDLVSPTLRVGSIDTFTVAGFSFAFTNGESVDFTNASSANATSFSWDFGDGTTSTLENPSHTYVANDTLTVTLIATGPCGSDTLTQTVEVSSVGIDKGLARFIRIYPNPSNGAFTVSFSEMNAQTVAVSVYTIHGQEVVREVSDKTVGNFNTQMDISNQPDGTYLLKIEVDGALYMKQILKH